MSTYSKEHINYLKKKKKEKYIIIGFQLAIIIIFLTIWQVLANYEVINTFLYSSPQKILKTVIELLKNDLLKHIGITTYETLISFIVSTLLGIFVGAILWLNERTAKILDPYFTIINSLPKVALGPLIIIWVGASTNSIIFMALMISSILSIINIYNSFKETDENYITLMKSFKATKWQIFRKVILPYNKQNIFNTIKINISMSLIGVIMGELLVSKEGLGYLIMYGSQIFNINLVLTSVVILGLLSYLIYLLINKLESIFFQKKTHK